MPEFKDHFSSHATDYAKYRPHYPAVLFEYLASLANAHETAWDCATGNGQAALGLAPYFQQVVATDPSAQQIDNAIRHEKVSYRVAPAEDSGIPSHSIDLITVAQALHWFHFDRFYAEVRRVLKPQGVLAAWCYNFLRCEPEVDRILLRYYTEIIGSFWPPERKLLEDNYRDVSFPLEEMSAPPFEMTTRWDARDLLGYLGTWSATRRFISERGKDPIELIEREILEVWREPEVKRTIRWPLHLRVGTINPVA